MFRKSCLVAGAALMLLGSGKAAEAHVRFIEPYGRLWGARTFLCTPVDKRPKDALHAMPSKLDDPRQRVIVSPFVRHDDFSTLYGIGAAYANAQNEWHPWSIQGSYFHGELDEDEFGFGPGGDDDFDGGEVNGKYVLWQPANPKLPVISIVGAWITFGDLGDRYDALIAIDQCITPRLYFTANLGYAWLDSDFAECEEDFAAGVGLTYVIRQNLSISADYLFDNDVEGEDTWSVAAIWAINHTWALRVGGGKHDLVFGNLIWKMDFK
jgi:hypothetical protein